MRSNGYAPRTLRRPARDRFADAAAELAPGFSDVSDTPEAVPALRLEAVPMVTGRSEDIAMLKAGGDSPPACRRSMENVQDGGRMVLGRHPPA